MDVTKPQVRACYLCVAVTHPLSSPRLFLNQLPEEVCTNYPANIKAQLQARGSIEHFTSLRTKDVIWDAVRDQVVKDSDLPSSIVYPPPPKRRKETRSTKSGSLILQCFISAFCCVHAGVCRCVAPSACVETIAI